MSANVPLNVMPEVPLAPLLNVSPDVPLSVNTPCSAESVICPVVASTSLTTMPAIVRSVS